MSGIVKVALVLFLKHTGSLYRHNGVGYSRRHVSISRTLARRLTRNPSRYGSVTCKILLRRLNQPCESPFCSDAGIILQENWIFFFFSSFFGKKKNSIVDVLECVPSLVFAVFMSPGLHFHLHQQISLSIRFTTFLDASPPWSLPRMKS
jgi:hypothetical protein